ncbi:uncharacterized, partial [Tachysurus ichikawai]
MDYRVKKEEIPMGKVRGRARINLLTLAPQE